MKATDSCWRKGRRAAVGVGEDVDGAQRLEPPGSGSWLEKAEDGGECVPAQRTSKGWSEITGSLCPVRPWRWRVCGERLTAAAGKGELAQLGFGLGVLLDNL